jgi:hypothetical protein
MSEPNDRATIDDLRTLLCRGSAVARPEPDALPLSRADLAALVPHLTLAERRRLERLLPRTREEALAGLLDDVMGEEGLPVRRLTNAELDALYALIERMSGHSLDAEDVPAELRRVMPRAGEVERWLAAINALGEKFARGEEA